MAAVPDELRFFFRELITLTRTYTMLDDLEHYQTTRINPLAYRGALAMGRLLSRLGVLDDPADVFFLNKIDVETLAAKPTPDVMERCREKAMTAKASYRRAFAQTPQTRVPAAVPHVAVLVAATQRAGDPVGRRDCLPIRARWGVE